MILSEIKIDNDHTFLWKIEPMNYDPEQAVQTILFGGHRWRLEIIQQDMKFECLRCYECNNKKVNYIQLRKLKQSLLDAASAADICERITISILEANQPYTFDPYYVSLWREEIVLNLMDTRGSAASCIVGQILPVYQNIFTRNTRTYESRRWFLQLSFVLKDSIPKAIEETKTAFVYSDTKEVLNAVEALLQNSEDCDATLVVKGIEFKAHQCILKVRVPVFRSMFRADMEERKTGHVEITDCDPSAFKIFLQFIYSGKLNLPTETNASELYYIADKYDVKELIDFCVKFMTSHWTVGNFFDHIDIGCNLAAIGETELLKSGIKFLAQNFSQILSLPEWMAYLRDNPEGANELIKLAFECLVQCNKTKVLEETKTTLVYSETNKVLKAFDTLLQNSEDCDATLVVRGIEFKAHLCILKARVPVFQSMFRADMEEHKTGHVEITDCDPDAFKIFLQFIYSGKLDLQTEKNAHELYCIADKYDVKELIDFCVKFMTSHWTVGTFCDCIHIGCDLAANGEPELLKSGIKFLAQNFNRITSLPQWMAYLRNNPEEANELNRKAYECLLQCTDI